MKKEVFPTWDEIPEYIRFTETHQTHILINGELKKWSGPRQLVWSPVYIKNESTYEQAQIGSYPLATNAEALEALDGAINAYKGGRGEWPSMTMQQRIDAINSFTNKMIARRSEIIKLIVWEIGKSVNDATKEFDRTVDYIYGTIKAAQELDRKSGEFLEHDKFVGQIKRLPCGIVLCMGPFNYPLNETFTMLIPALIMGNTLLFKPPKLGTLLFEPLLDAFKESFPAGVVNTLYGRGKNIIPALMESGKIDVLGLIGSSKVADSLKKMHPKSNRLKTVFGLDAKNVAIITGSSNLDLTVREVIAGTLSFNGQRCTALKFLFVEDSIADLFISRLSKEISALNIGMPWEEGVNITPLAEPTKPDYLKDCIEEAKYYGSSIIESFAGYSSNSFVSPTIVHPVTKEMKLYWEEQFGPVIPILPFKQLDTPINYILESSHGQQMSIFSENPDEIAYLVDTLSSQVGRININSQCQRGPDSFPFSGRKDSADSTLSVNEALLAFSVDSIIVAKVNVVNESLLEAIISNKKSSRLNKSIL